MGTQPRFTPQNSPAVASPASSVSAEDEARERQGGNLLNELHDRRISRRQNPAVNENEICTSLCGWTAHQSHGQATILFYVPRWIREDAMDVVIGNDYVIAGIRGQKPIIKARLTGNIDTNTSRWQLENRSKRHRSRSRTRMRTRSSDHSSSSSGGVSSTGAGVRSTSHQDQHSPPLQSDQAGQNASNRSTSENRGRISMNNSQNNSRPGSPVQSETSSFELLARSTDTVGTRASEGQESPHNNSSPHSLSQSMNLSSEDDDVPYYPVPRKAISNASSYGDGGIRSMDSSMASVDSDNAARDNEIRMSDDPTRDAKLVTLHLDKKEGGIWPCVVSGAPILTEQRSSSTSTFPPIAKLISVQSQGSLNAAISEAIRQQQQSPRQHERNLSISSSSDHSEDGNERRNSEGDGESGEENVNQSTMTIDTIASDDSTTVLGSSSVRQVEEEMYDMDPTTLTLMGLQYARKGANMPFGGAERRGELQAFECYRRAWKEAEIPTAIEHLVHDYLPLNQSIQSTSSIRQRLTAALGGPTALAKLYVSYAHLHMRTYDYKRPLLALPLSGTTNNPYGASYIIHELQQAGGNSELETQMAAGPLQYLKEARELDGSVEIPNQDWQEAEMIHEARDLEWRSRSVEASASAAAASARSGPASPTSKSENMMESDAGSQPSSTTTNKRRRKAGSVRRDKMGKHSRHHHSTPPSDQGIVFLVVSRAALLSVVVAGGMAVAGWWRRAAAANG